MKYQKVNRKSRRRKKLALRALSILLPAALLVAVIFAVSSCINQQEAPSSSQESLQEPPASSAPGGSSQEEASSQLPPSSQEASSSGSVSQGEASSQGASSVNEPKPNTGIYAGVTWRSPYAKPADIEKYGRDLMLLNNYYELPADFEWNLVYFSNGEPVDAMSLNSKEYDKVQAVDAAAYEPLKEMFAAAKADGVPLQLVSPYRSISLQDRLFGSLVTTNISAGLSKEAAIKKANVSRTFTGTSEHNTGYGFDLSKAGDWTLTQAFDQTAQFKWLSEHAEEYGFILRYARDKVDITGIMYEPWHYRYVGVEHAKKINELGMCLEEYIEYLGGY